MRIISVERTESFLIETDEGYYRSYRRDVDAPNWQILMGESWESHYNDTEIEQAYQEWHRAASHGNMFTEEALLAQKEINLGEILELQLHHDIQIIRGCDLQYCCYIDGLVYASALTPIYALVCGVKVWKEKFIGKN